MPLKLKLRLLTQRLLTQTQTPLPSFQSFFVDRCGSLPIIDDRFPMSLTNEKCTACRRDAPQVTEAEVSELKPHIPEWTLVERDGIRQLERVFRFPNFAEALQFTDRVGALAEEEGHHPAILTEWGRVTVTLWTHKIRGLHRNDFIMAAKIDSFAPGPM
jgi:4a-hydroxytetrahydrobiopterin dehydratase